MFDKIDQMREMMQVFAYVCVQTVSKDMSLYNENEAKNFEILLKSKDA